ncbi:carboxypeptidase M32 [Fusibacter sp. JL216-2]|uniref:carboxypeptidase M32 n=1 Tax=Fusibacter sp. JL216-2 TaxID=3071453 RepID=UPI003D343D6B
MDLKSVRDSFIDRLDQIKGLEYAGNIVYWDLATGAGSRGIESRSRAFGVLSSQVQVLMTNEAFLSELEILEDNFDKLDDHDVMVVKEARYQLDRISKIPPDEYRAYTELTSKATVAWEKAKDASDFNAFAPYLKEIVDYKRRFADYFGYEGHPYNALIEDFERGMTVEVLDDFFEELKASIVPVVKAIGDKNEQPMDDFLFLSYPKDKQEVIAKKLLKTIGFDTNAGELKESEHPFTMGLDVTDVRLTTHYYENHLTSSLFSTIHEGGHGIYEQNFSKEISGTILADGSSAGIHESQSRLFENNIGRSQAFWSYFYPQLQEAFPKQLDRVSLQLFVQAINKSEPSFIRVEADELTYPLHIMLRYELEKELISGTLEVDDLKEAWNEKMVSYLGIKPEDDAQGVLQDVHWADGLFGYFPSYALGTAYAAQIQNALSEVVNIEESLVSGDFTPINQWLKEKIHKFGLTKSAEEVLEEATGRKFDAKYYTDYLESKYKKLYDL